MARFSMINLNGPLDYSDMAGIYGGVAPVDLYYNDRVSAGSEPSPADFMAIYQGVAGDETVNLQGQNWTAKGNQTTWKEYYTGIADQIPKGNFAAYDIQ